MAQPRSLPGARLWGVYPMALTCFQGLDCGPAIKIMFLSNIIFVIATLIFVVEVILVLPH